MTFIFNYAKLKGKIIEVCESNAAFIEKMGWSRPTFTRKISGESEWSDAEIMKAAEILGITPEEIHIYFFCIAC